MATETTPMNVLTADALLNNWQGHRRLTRRVIEAFPEDKLFQFSVGGMRPFAEMAWEFIRMAVPIVDGVSTGKWEEFKAEKPGSKAEHATATSRRLRPVATCAAISRAMCARGLNRRVTTLHAAARHDAPPRR